VGELSLEIDVILVGEELVSGISASETNRVT
jgi:hypothetical protein